MFVVKASLSSLSKMKDLQSCGSFLLELKKKAEECCVVGNLLYELQADSADQEAHDSDTTECEVCCEEFSEEPVDRQAVLICNKVKVCRSCILEQLGKELKEGKNPNCLICFKPYLPSRANLLTGKCCIFCLHEQNDKVCS